MKLFGRFSCVVTALAILSATFSAVSVFAAAPVSGRRALRNNASTVATRLHAIRALATTTNLNLVIGLPLQNREALTNLLKELYDPNSTNYHHWLTSDQFRDRFCPTEADYQKVIQFAQAHGLKVTYEHSNRALLDVSGPVADIENAFQTKINVYQHPTESRTFYAPETEPTVETDLPILTVSGLDNYIIPHRLDGGIKPIALDTNQPITSYATGSGPNGNFTGFDFRHAYVPGVTNDGAGQYIAIVDVGGPYYPLDIYMYQTNAGLSTDIVVTNILLSGWTGIPTGDSQDDGEETLDIDMAMSMAPGAVIMNYEGEAHDVFNQIAVDNKAKQMTLSYGFGIDASIIQTFQQFAAQGQSFSQASGDGGADLDGGTGLTGNPYATIVGGTSLTTASGGGAWVSEKTWGGSGGGISGYGIPDWQQGVATAANQGSTTYRNYPDVSMHADTDIWWYLKNGQGGAVGGTSAASPLWAGFMALVNQQAAAAGKPSAGFVNPAIYALGLGAPATYASYFHDITTGNTFNNHNALRYAATVGYDLCTGWGTPRGQNTINFLAGIGTNDFVFYPSRGTFSLVAGASANATITLFHLNGFAGNATFSLSNVPSDVTASISPLTTGGTTTLNIATATNTVPGSYTATITAHIGGLSHSMPITIAIDQPIPDATPVDLSTYYNRTGIYTDGHTFSGGLDAAYSSFSANLLGNALSWNGLAFDFGSPNVLDVVYCNHQTINLPAGNFNTLQLLAAGVEGAQTAQTFTVTYTDNTTATFTQSFSDWANQQSYSGETVAYSMPYRNLNNGGQQTLKVSVDGYTFVLDQSKTVKSLTLPSNSNLIILSAILANNQVSVPLSNYYNRAGIYTDKTTFTNPPTGGLDGGGAAYSGTLLGGSQAWNDTLFSFGPVNATNVISSSGQIIPLPTGNYTKLNMLATAVQGNQLSQLFTVTYTDNSTASFSQNLSDWYSPKNYAGESKAIVMGHRNSSDGTLDNRVFYLYGYSFALNSAKTVKSIRLPNQSDVIVAAISLMPNWQPTFNTDPLNLPDANAGQFYSKTIATNASDLNSDTLTFAKVSGPTWLNVAANGALSGTPLSADAGDNNFVVSVADPGGLTNTATVNINVIPAPPVVSTITYGGGNISLNWSGGVGPFEIQATTNLVNPNWQTIGTVSGNTMPVTPTNNAMFYRIIGQ